MHYQAYGLRLESDLPIPEFLEADHPAAQPDFVIKKGNFSSPRSSKATQTGPFTFIEGSILWFRIPGLADFEMNNGREIRYSPSPGIDNDTIRLILLGLPVAALLVARGITVLNGAAFVIASNTYLLLGRRGPTRADLVASCLSGDGEILSDKFIALGPENRVLIGNRRIEMPGWIEGCGLNDKIYLTRSRKELNRLSWVQDYSPTSFPSVATVAYLIDGGISARADAGASTLRGLDKQKALLACLYKYKTLEPLYRDSDVLQMLVHLSAKLDLYRIPSSLAGGFDWRDHIRSLTRS